MTNNKFVLHTSPLMFCNINRTLPLLEQLSSHAKVKSSTERGPFLQVMSSKMSVLSITLYY